MPQAPRLVLALFFAVIGLGLDLRRLSRALAAPTIGRSAPMNLPCTTWSNLYCTRSRWVRKAASTTSGPERRW
jgi:hypothetical protein